MRILDSFDALDQVFQVYGEIIVFPLVAQNNTFLKYLNYSGNIRRVCCVAAGEVPDGVAQHFIHERPIIPFENLLHFRETAAIIVAAPEEFHAEINDLLTYTGFKNTFFISDDLNDEVSGALTGLHRSGRVDSWFKDHIIKKLNDLDYKIEEQNEICAVNTKAFAEYRNAFRGKEVVIVGCGPTVQYYKPIPGAIHICLNRAWKRDDIPFDYLFFQDNSINANEKRIEKGFNKIKKKIFVGKPPLSAPYDYISPPEIYSLMAKNILRYYPNMATLDQHIFQDICYKPLVDFFSIAFPALHFSLFTYPSKIYLVGLDTTATGHFYNESAKDEMKSKENMQRLVGKLKVGYARMKMFAKQYYPDTEIISVNPVGLRGLFQEINTGDF